MESFLEDYEFGEFSDVICVGKTPSLTVLDPKKRAVRLSFSSSTNRVPENYIDPATKARCFNFFSPRVSKLESSLYVKRFKGWMTKEIKGQLNEIVDEVVLFQLAYALKVISRQNIFFHSLKDSISFYESPGRNYYIKSISEDHSEVEVNIISGTFVRLDISEAFEDEEDSAEVKNLEALNFLLRELNQPQRQSLDEFLEFQVYKENYETVMPCFQTTTKDSDLVYFFKKFVVFPDTIDPVNSCNEWLKKYCKVLESKSLEVQKFVPNFSYNFPIVANGPERPDDRFYFNLNFMRKLLEPIERDLCKIYEYMEPEATKRYIAELEMLVGKPYGTLDSVFEDRSKALLDYKIHLSKSPKVDSVWSITTNTVNLILDKLLKYSDVCIQKTVSRVQNINRALGAWSTGGAVFIALDILCDEFNISLRRSHAGEEFMALMSFDICSKAIEFIENQYALVRNVRSFMLYIEKVVTKVSNISTVRVIPSFKKQTSLISNADPRVRSAVIGRCIKSLKTIQAFVRVGSNLCSLQLKQDDSLIIWLSKFERLTLQDEEREDLISRFALKGWNALEEVPNVTPEEGETLEQPFGIVPEEVETESLEEVPEEAETESLEEVSESESEEPEEPQSSMFGLAAIGFGLAALGAWAMSSVPSFNQPQAQSLPPGIGGVLPQMPSLPTTLVPLQNVSIPSGPELITGAGFQNITMENMTFTNVFDEVTPAPPMTPVNLTSDASIISPSEALELGLQVPSVIYRSNIYPEQPTSKWSDKPQEPVKVQLPSAVYRSNVYPEQPTSKWSDKPQEPVKVQSSGGSEVVMRISSSYVNTGDMVLRPQHAGLYPNSSSVFDSQKQTEIPTPEYSGEVNVLSSGLFGATFLAFAVAKAYRKPVRVVSLHFEKSSEPPKLSEKARKSRVDSLCKVMRGYLEQRDDEKRNFIRTMRELPEEDAREVLLKYRYEHGIDETYVTVYPELNDDDFEEFHNLISRYSQLDQPTKALVISYIRSFNEADRRSIYERCISAGSCSKELENYNLTVELLGRITDIPKSEQKKAAQIRIRLQRLEETNDVNEKVEIARFLGSVDPDILRKVQAQLAEQLKIDEESKKTNAEMLRQARERSKPPKFLSTIVSETLISQDVLIAKTKKIREKRLEQENQRRKLEEKKRKLEEQRKRAELQKLEEDARQELEIEQKRESRKQKRVERAETERLERERLERERLERERLERERLENERLEREERELIERELELEREEEELERQRSTIDLERERERDQKELEAFEREREREEEELQEREREISKLQREASTKAAFAEYQKSLENLQRERDEARTKRRERLDESERQRKQKELEIQNQALERQRERERERTQRELEKSQRELEELKKQQDAQEWEKRRLEGVKKLQEERLEALTKAELTKIKDEGLKIESPGNLLEEKSGIIYIYDQSILDIRYAHGYPGNVFGMNLRDRPLKIKGKDLVSFITEKRSTGKYTDFKFVVIPERTEELKRALDETFNPSEIPAKSTQRITRPRPPKRSVFTEIARSSKSIRKSGEINKQKLEDLIKNPAPFYEEILNPE